MELMEMLEKGFNFILREKELFGGLFTTIILFIFKIPGKIWYFFKSKFRKNKKTKENTKILFIDDKTFASMISGLKNAGYKVRRIPDISGPNDNEINDIDIFFVDIQGVGKKMQFQDQGFGIVNFLRDTFPKSKIVIYSAETHMTNPAYSKADNVIKKDSDLYEFSKIIDDLILQYNQ